MKKLNETQWSPNISNTDENLSLNGVYQELKLPSLARSIFTVSDMHGPTAAIFNITGNDHGGISLVRSEVEIYDNEPVRTKITQETLQDIETQFGEDGKRSVAVLLRGFANDNENEKTIGVRTSGSRNGFLCRYGREDHSGVRMAGGRCGGYGSFHSGRLQQMEGTWPLRGVL